MFELMSKCNAFNQLYIDMQTVLLYLDGLKSAGITLYSSEHSLLLLT